MKTFELISHRVDTTPLANQPKAESTIDYRKPSFYLPTLTLCGVLVGIFVVGSIVEWFRAPPPQRDDGEDKGDELTLQEWRSTYKMELKVILNQMRRDMGDIKLKVDMIAVKLIGFSESDENKIVHR